MKPLRWRIDHKLDWLISRPIAHRGLHNVSKGIIENSRSAFAAAVESGYPIECDLQLTKEGQPVVFHDEALDRLTSKKGPLKERTTDEIRSIKLRGSRDSIQSFGELLEQIQGRVPLVVELKSHWNGDPTLAYLAAQACEGYAGEVAFMSFDPDLVSATRLAAPHIPRGIVADRVNDPFYSGLPFSRRLELRNFSHAVETQPHFISFEWTGLPFAPVSGFQRLEMPIICWTVRSLEAASQARRYADQITFEGFMA